MTQVVNHLKTNLVAYLALFVALGGTSFAAVNLPTGSVGSKQLRNGSVTAPKLAKGAVMPANLNATAIAAHIAMWAKISSDGRIVSASPKAAVTPFATPGVERVTWQRAVSSRCLALANAANVAPLTTVGSANVSGPVRHRRSTDYVISTFNGSGSLTPENVDIVVMCP
jgi:hypothetical protein